MKKVKLTPILLFFPISIIGYALILCYKPGWIPFRLLFIIGFTLIMCIMFLIDRLIASQLKLKTIWVVEIILIIVGFIFASIYNLI